MIDPKNHAPSLSSEQIHELVKKIRHWATVLGFQQTGFTDTDLSAAEGHLLSWLGKNYHGEMEWMQRHGTLRTRPQELVPGTCSIITVRMDYLPETQAEAEHILSEPGLGYISRYALGRDYHKLMRQRLQKLATQIEKEIGPFGYRAFVDSAPVQEKALAEKSAIGWIGKHSNIINKDTGSWFFLGELYTDLPLPADSPAQNHCGDCQACLDICPTHAIVEPYVVDARRCISYLTIEHSNPIPIDLRPMLGNRIYGCDDCQLVCPWNRFTQLSQEKDFAPRHALDNSKLVDLFSWNEATFLKNTEGNAIRRIGYERWQRNIAVALGNAPTSIEVNNTLEKANSESDLVSEHIHWAQQQHN
ncbi:MAG: tRNA epoxyqueuosine(34) reductase QueG [Gammaproteobacteria bacterium]|nr:tRNA epoxyqueuosine(34) reductase QueG [Gammaproteobacteria bacterium]